MSHVVFVDDDPHVLAALERAVHLREKTWPCESFTSAAAALVRIAQGDIDVVVSDVRMPGMDGVEFLLRLKGDPRTQHVPVIMLTGHADSGSKRSALELGAYDFVTKPADPEDLWARLCNAVRLKSYEDRLREQNSILERQLIQSQRMEVVGLLASGIFHDLNNILQSVIGRTELAACETEAMDQVQQNLKLALASAEHARRLARQILSLGRPTAAPREAHDLGALIDESLHLLAFAIPQNIRVAWDRPPVSAPLNADATQIHQIVMNLCTNAVQAMPGGGTLKVSLDVVEVDPSAAPELEEATPGTYARLGIADTGTGMDPSTCEQIFDPFFTTKEPGRGTGVGLSVVQRIVRNHGGVVTVDSTPGQGTSFFVHLPCTGAEIPDRAMDKGGTHVGQEACPVRG
jgi:signal transduction histidine kinase